MERAYRSMTGLWAWTWLGVLLGVAGLAGCGDDGGTGNPMVNPDGGPDTGVVEVGCPALRLRPQGERSPFINDIINTNTTWTCQRKYSIFDTLVIDSGDPENPATLTIEEGTIVESSVSGEFPAILVTPNGRLNIRGTDEEPVVFTAQAESARRGEWGGIFLVGRATVNTPTGFGTLTPWAERFGDRAVYGGGDEPVDDGSCGRLDHLRVEFAGYVAETSPQPYTPAITLAGCGSGTVLDYVQVHRPLNRGIEIRGGSPILRHVIVDGPSVRADQFGVPTDGIAWMEGWTGQAQFIVAQMYDGGIGLMGMNRDDDPTAEPVSDPTFYNISIFGRGFRPGNIENGGIRLAFGSRGTFRNLVMTGMRDFAVDVFGSASGTALAEGEATVQAGLFYDIGPQVDRSVPAEIFFPVPDPTPEDGVNEETVLTNPELGNTFGEPDPDFEGNPYSVENPNYNVIESAVAGGLTPSAGFEPAGDFKGAVDPREADWTQGWTTFRAQ